MHHLFLSFFSDSDIRFCVLSSLDERFDAHLAQAENLSALFVALNDEVDWKYFLHQRNFYEDYFLVFYIGFVFFCKYKNNITVLYCWPSTGVWDSWACDLYYWQTKRFESSIHHAITEENAYSGTCLIM